VSWSRKSDSCSAALNAPRDIDFFPLNHKGGQIIRGVISLHNRLRRAYKVDGLFSRRFYPKSTGDSILQVLSSTRMTSQDISGLTPSPYNAANRGDFSWAFGGDGALLGSQYHFSQDSSAGSIRQNRAHPHTSPSSWQSPLPSECGSPITDDASASARYQQGVPPPRTKRAQVKSVFPLDTS
jgi:hypothetical protein